MGNIEGAVRGLISLLDPNGSAQLGNHYMDTWGGMSFLEILLQRIKSIRSIDHVAAAVGPHISKEVCDLLDKYSVQVLLETEKQVKPHVDLQPHMVSSRKWGYQNWTGCPNGYSIYDETMPMGMIGFFSDILKPKTLICFSPEMPFINPKAVEHMIEFSGKAHEEMDYAVLAMYLPKGMSPMVITESGNAGLSQSKVWIPNHYFGSSEIDYPTRMRSSLNFPKLNNERRNFMLRSKRDLKKLQAWDGTLNNLKESLDTPRECQMEITSQPHHINCRLPNLSADEGHMSLDLFRSTLEQLTTIDDLLLTIGDLGAIHEHPDLPQIIEILKENPTYGTHLIFDAKYVFENVDQFISIYEMGFDILTLRLTSLGYEKDDLLKYETEIAKIAEKYIPEENRTVINLEIHKFQDNWRLGEVLEEWLAKYRMPYNLTGFNDFCGKNPQEVTLPVYEPRTRGVCEKLNQQIHVLPSGKVTQCRQDFSGSHVVGDLKRQSLEDVWNSPEMKELRQKNCAPYGSATPLCETCHQGYFV